MIAILIWGVLPALILLRYIYNLDKIEREPTDLLIKLFVLGGVCTLPAGFLESLLIPLAGSALDVFSLKYEIISNFICIALVEEGLKHFVLRTQTWNHPEFDFRFDAVVYSVAVSLGFAAVENVGYILGFGFSVAPVRAVTAIPLHCIAAIFMGFYFGQAKFYERLGLVDKQKGNMRLSIIVPVAIHGFYDLAASSQYEIMSIVFLVFIVLLDIVAFVAIKNFSKADVPLHTHHTPASHQGYGQVVEGEGHFRDEQPLGDDFPGSSGDGF